MRLLRRSDCATVVRMNKWLRVFAWLAAAPLAWVGGSLLLCYAPFSHRPVRTPVCGLPSRTLTAGEVAALNERLKGRVVRSWNIAPGVCCIEWKPWEVAVPAGNGGLELVQARPRWVWADAETEAEWQNWVERRNGILQEWLAELKEKGAAAR